MTHAVDFLQDADRIIIMEGGKVKYNGSYEEVMHSEEIKHVIETIAKTAVDDEAVEEQPEDVIDLGQTVRKSFISEEGTNITEDENKEVINVSWRVYWHLIYNDKNWIIFL